MEHLSDPDDFARYHLMYTPGLVINEQLVVGRPAAERPEIMAALERHLASKPT